MFNKAKKGSVQHFTEIANRLEGKVQSDEERAASGITVVTINRAFRPKREPAKELETSGETITVNHETSFQMVQGLRQSNGAWL